jgi:hypothetical protein
VATTQTEKSRYPSRYSPQAYVTAAQYIIELICEKKASQARKELPIKFWDLPEWRTFFVSQLRKCHILLKKYGEGAVIAALKGDRCKNINSLFAPWLEDIIKDQKEMLDAKIEKSTEVLERKSTMSKPRQVKLDKRLEGLDG